MDKGGLCYSYAAGFGDSDLLSAYIKIFILNLYVSCYTNKNKKRDC